MSIESPFAVYICCCTRWRPPKALPNSSACPYTRRRIRHRSVAFCRCVRGPYVSLSLYFRHDRRDPSLLWCWCSHRSWVVLEGVQVVDVWVLNYPSPSLWTDREGRDTELLLNCWPPSIHPSIAEIFFLNSLLRLAWDEIEFIHVFWVAISLLVALCKCRCNLATNFN